VNGPAPGQEQHASFLSQWPIRHCGSLSLKNLRTSRYQYDGASSCCKMKLYPSACSRGNSQSLNIRKYEILVIVFPSNENGPYTFSLEAAQITVSLGEFHSYSTNSHWFSLNALSRWTFNINLSLNITLNHDDPLTLLEAEHTKRLSILDQHFDKN